jgi:predicted lipid-binding transport protein (Tim44 family)
MNDDNQRGKMNMKIIKSIAIFAALLMVTVAVLNTDAFARAGGGRSIGSTGSRSYSRPSTPYSQPSPSQTQTAPLPYQQPAGGGFFRNMAGGILGGMLGGMLFRGLGFGGGGGIGGGGFGLFEIILIAGIAYMIYRMVKKRREEPVAYQSTYEQGGYQQGYATPQQDIGEPSQAGPADLSSGLAYIRQMDPNFAENRFTDNAMDIFFKIQSAWMNRDLAPAAPLLTDEMRGIFQNDIDRMLREKRVNRLENIAVRSVEITEAWQEQGQDFITAGIYANLLDYTTDDASGAVVEGSKTEPVKFEEFWTFTRPLGNNPWRLSAINQA